MKKILIIEDNLEVRENTAEIVELSNYKVITAENGKLGVELALKEKPDLIICDIMMPVLDGYGVFHLLSKHKETSVIPFIFLTAKSERTDFRKGMEMGVDDYITKPFDGIELLRAIEVRLNKSALLQQRYEGPSGMTDFLGNVKQVGKVLLASDEREVYNYNNKTFIYTSGQRPRAMYHVVSGKIKISRMNEAGKEFITDIHGPGEYFGYTAILENVHYQEEAQALEHSSLMLITAEDFLQLISQDMGIAQTFIRIITQNIAGKEESLLNLAYNSLRKKVAYGLMQLHEKYKVDDHSNTVLNLSRDNMAKTFGVATESLIRTLGDFKDEKLVALESGKVTIINKTKLRDLPY